MLIWSLTCFENAKRVLGFELLFCFVQNYSKFKFISSEQAEFVRRLEYNFFERSEFEQCFLPHLALMEIQITNNNNKDIKAFGLLSGWLSLCQPITHRLLTWESNGEDNEGSFLQSTLPTYPLNQTPSLSIHFITAAYYLP